MAKYDGLIIPRSYNDYINKSDPLGVSQALQLTGVMDDTPTAGSSKPVKSSGLVGLSAVDVVETGNMHPVTSNAVSRAMSYSTEEVNTGKKWIDGKPIYSKTYYNVSNFPQSAGLTNVDVITKINAVAKDVSSNFYPLPFITVISGVTYYTNIYYNKNNNAIYSDSNSNIESANITIEYTKTTD